jgi:hypothetical protein
MADREEREENHTREKLTSYDDGIKTGRGMMKGASAHKFAEFHFSGVQFSAKNV